MAKSVRDKSGDTPVLDQGIVITGDVVVKLFGLKLLPIKLRLLISSKDLATALGLDWWSETGDPSSRRAAPKRSKQKSRPASNVSDSRRPALRNGSRRFA